MAGKHKFASEVFIQSGSIAQFRNGIEVDGSTTVNGTVSATSFLYTNGDPVSTGGGSVPEFFAGTVEGVEDESPQSLDHFIGITSTNGDPTNPTQVLAENSGVVVIKAVGSDTFSPNYFNFIKVGNENEPLITVQQGASNTYTPTSLEERTAGTHRYIIYAADTTLPGETHRVFHTVTLSAFVNVLPIIQPPATTTYQIQPIHDTNTANVTLEFTNSFDDNHVANEDDFITKFTAVRTTPAGTTLNSTLDSYDISLSHPDPNLGVTESPTGTIEVTSDTTPGLADSSSKMSFKVNLTNYNNVNSNTNTIETSTNQTEIYTVSLEDKYVEDDGNVEGTYNVIVSPPNTATISDIKVKFEGGDNQGGFTNTLSDSHTHTLLYDEGLNPPTLLDTSTLDSRYKSSCVRIKVQANVNEPTDASVSPSHTTAIQILKSDTTAAGVGVLDDTSTSVGFFQMGGLDGAMTADKFNDIAIDNAYVNISEEYNFKTLTGFNTDGATTKTWYLGASTLSNLVNNTLHVTHGNHNHHIVTPTEPNNLIINKCPDVLIKNIELEVENIYNSGVGGNSTTRELIYGVNKIILTDDIPTFFPDDTIHSYNTLINQSRIRVRVKCQITEPFGPAHNGIYAAIQSKFTDPTTNTTSTNGTVQTIISLKDDNNDTLNSNLTNSSYTTSHPHGDGSQNGKELKVSNYVSEFYEIALPGTPGDHTLDVTFVPENNFHTAKGIGITTDAIDSAATITLTPVPNGSITNIETEVETHGDSEIGTFNSLRTVLYGDSRVTRADSTNLTGHGQDTLYISHSVSRFRVKGKITEPVGPGISTVSAQMQKTSAAVISNIASSFTIDPSTPILPSDNNANFEEITVSTDGSGNRITEFITSWNAGGSPVEVSPASTSSYNIFTSFTPNMDSNAGNTLNETGTPQTTNLDVYDTLKTEIQLNRIAMETSNGSNTPADPNAADGNVPTSFDSSHTRNVIWPSDVTNTARTKIFTTILEPMGPLHHTTQIRTKFDRLNNADNHESAFQNYNTSSANTDVTETHRYINGRLRTIYQSEFQATDITETSDGDEYRLHVFNDDVNHSPSNENGFTKFNNFLPNDDAGSSGNFNGNLTYLKVTRTLTPQVSNFQVELEGNKTHSQILHGNTNTEISTAVNNTYNITSQAEIVKVRVVTTVPDGNSVEIDVTGGTSTLSFDLYPGAPDLHYSTLDNGFRTYTSDYKNIELTGGNPSSTTDNLVVTNPTTINKTITATLIQIEDNNAGTNGINPASNTVTIGITGAPKATLSTTIKADGSNGSTTFSSSVDFDHYYVYPPGTTTGYKSNSTSFKLGQVTSANPPTLTSINPILYEDNNINLTFSESDTYISCNGSITHPTTTKTILLSRPNRYSPYDNTLKTGTVTLLASNPLTGNGKAKATKTIHIIPATANSMSGNYGTIQLPHNYSSASALLSADIGSTINYKTGDTPSNPTTKASVNYILNVHNGSTIDYTLDLNTHSSPAYNGNYATNNRAFNYGDKGNLKVFLNGTTADITIPIENNFNTVLKTGDQSWPGTPETTTALSVQVNKVAPFNGIHQNLDANGNSYPYGFQAWDANIDITSKPRDGYNFLNMSHTDISGTPDQSMNTFEWFYNDTNPNDNATLGTTSFSTITTTPYFSISGVKYFKKNVAFNFTMTGITNLIGKTYHSSKEIMYTERVNNGGTLTIKGDGQSQNGSGKLLHNVTNTSAPNNRRGLRFNTGDNDMIPTIGTTVNIKTEIIATTFASGYDKQFGQTFSLEYHQYDGNTWSTDVNLGTIIIGRFADENTNQSTNHIRKFFIESKRWDPTTLFNNAYIEQDNTTLWLGTSTGYNSETSLLTTNGLQQRLDGNLYYPSGDYTENPGAINYDNISNDRFYYTALQVPGVTDGDEIFRLKIFGNFALSDIFQAGGGGGVDSKNIRIDVKSPGAVDSDGGTGWSNPANNNGSSNSSTGTTLNTEGTSNGANGFKSYLNFTDGSSNDISGGVQFRVNMRKNMDYTSGIILIKVRFKPNFTKYISRIELTSD